VAAISGRSVSVTPISWGRISVSDMSAIVTRHATFLGARCKMDEVQDPARSQSLQVHLESEHGRSSGSPLQALPHQPGDRFY